MHKPNLLTPAALAVVLYTACAPALRADIFVSKGGGGQVQSYSEYTGAPKLTINTNPCCAYTSGVAIGNGNLYVADETELKIWSFNALTGAPNGTGIFASLSPPAAPLGLTFGPDGNLYMADNTGYIRRFNGLTAGETDFSCTPALSGPPCYPYDLTFGPDGNLYVSDFGSGGVLQFSVSGSGLTFMKQFIPGVNPGKAFPGGLHFDANGNLYVSWSFPIPNTSDYFNEILEYNGSSGAPVSFAVPYSGQQDFAFGPDNGIIVAGSPAFTKYNPSSGSVLSIFGSTGLLANPAGFIAIGGPCIVCAPFPMQIYPPVGLDSSQTLRLTVVEGPVWVPPGVPVEVQLGFQNSQGASVGPTKVATLNPGQTASLDLVANTLISSGRIEIQPVVTTVPGTPFPMASILGSAEVYTATYGLGSLLYPGVPTTSSTTGSPSFLPQGVALGQSIQINAAAAADNPCVAMLSFADSNGNLIGPTEQVNLNPGQMASLTFNPNRYTKSGRQEYIPQITPNNPTGGQGVAPACLGSAEVFMQKSGSTSTYQTSSPAIGVMSTVP